MNKWLAGLAIADLFLLTIYFIWYSRQKEND